MFIQEAFYKLDLATPFLGETNLCHPEVISKALQQLPRSFWKRSPKYSPTKTIILPNFFERIEFNL